MKTNLKIKFLVALSAVMLLSLAALSQVKVTGHVFAEVVESVSAKSNAVTNLTANITSAGANDNLNLGSVTISTGSHLSYNVMMTNANLSDSRGEKIDMEIYSAGSSRSTVEIKGKAILADNQQSGLYKGSYTMVFAYN